MKLKKATNIKIDYPSRETINPILIGVGMTLAFSACSQTVAEKETIISEPKQERRSNIEEVANVAGGMPVHIPPPKEKNASSVHKFKTDTYQIEKEIIVPVVTAGVPIPKSK
ncbi:MAG: hypothetical protein KAG56_06365 [Sulfurovaceae bacterium]|nr:hypothetical protein [Sulfurovaceae bacterium]